MIGIQWPLTPFAKKVVVSTLVISTAMAMNAPAAIGFGTDVYHRYIIGQQSYKAKYGYWKVLNLPPNVRVNAVHASLLRTGKLLIIAGSGNDVNNFKARSFKSLLWDPVTDTTKLIPTPDDMFCSGHSQLIDGKVLVAGGTLRFEVLKADVKNAGGTMQVSNEDPNKPRKVPKGTVFVAQIIVRGRRSTGAEYVSDDDLILPPARKVKKYYTAQEIAAAGKAGRKLPPWHTVVVRSQQAVFVQAAVPGAGQVVSTVTQFKVKGLGGNDGETLYGMADNINMNPKEYQGIKAAYEFNPDTEQYEQVAPMQYARWYPTLSPLPDGKVLTVSGLDGTGALVPGNNEYYDPKTKSWFAAPTRTFATYPALFLTAKGTIFFSGANGGYGPVDKGTYHPGRMPGFWDLQTNAFQPIPGLRQQAMVEAMATVLLPPAQMQKVAVFGGSGPGEKGAITARTATIDLSAPNPHFVNGPDLPAGKTRYLNAVTLPDDTVLTTGGSHEYRGKHASDILKANIYHPDTNSFTPAADPTVGRNYHSEALLLPDGRVVTLGSNPLFADKDDTLPPTFEQRIEIYSPPYLFHGARPTVSGGPARVVLGKNEKFATTTPESIAQVRLIRPSSVTHVTDVQQRSISVPFQVNGNDLNLAIPSNPNLVIPGWYMLFAVDKNGTPSIARWVQVVASPDGATGQPAAPDGRNGQPAVPDSGTGRPGAADRGAGQSGATVSPARANPINVPR